MSRAFIGLAAVMAVLMAAASLQAQVDAPLETVLARAAAYVADYQTRLAGIVAEEHYRQNVQITSRGGRQTREFRELRSDLLMVKPTGADRWQQFRDVFEVDRRPIRDRDQRLYKLFVESSTAARTRAEEIQAESARYNIGPVMRTVNMPILALLFFERSVQPIITFKKGNAGNVKRFEGLAEAADVWLIEYRETQDGTLVRGQGNRDIPSHGRIWIDSTSGRILRTELISEDMAIRATIDVSYKIEPGLDLLVPGEMREVYLVRRTESRIDGRAAYSRFRQFTVTTTEKPKQ
ncbi:MAG: hypothetical protein Q7R30_21570 [Acidobacteriota bacterium]|nr:hypothetical protein [Acidobacteriota bacterium]